MSSACSRLRRPSSRRAEYSAVPAANTASGTTTVHRGVSPVDQARTQIPVTAAEDAIAAYGASE